MSCSSLSILSKLALFISGHFLNGTVYKDDVGRVTAIRLANTNPTTHQTSYTVLSHPIYSGCFEKSQPLLFDNAGTKWVPNEPLDTWDHDELAEELVKCKNSFRVLRSRHISLGRSLYQIKKRIERRIAMSKKIVIPTVKKIPLRPTHAIRKIIVVKEAPKVIAPVSRSSIVPLRTTQKVMIPAKKEVTKKKKVFHKR